MTQSLTVAYVLPYFPRLTETFVAEEIRAVRAQGVDVPIISLLEPGPEPVQPRSRELLPHTWYAPGPLTLILWRAQFHFFLKSPRRYLGLLGTLLRQPYPRQPPALLAKRLLIFFKAVAVARHLEGSGVQLLHAHFAWLPGAAAWVGARLLDLPFTVTAHAYDVYSWKNELLPLLCRQADRIVTISEHNRRQIAALDACPPETVAVVHCGVDLAGLEGPPPRRAEQTAGPLRILSVGSLLAKKGHTHLIAACRLLRQRGLDFACTIIGAGPNEGVLRQQIEDHDLQDRVKLLGARPHAEVVAACREHDLFVLASVAAPDGDVDGIPVGLMEAGAMGLPLVSTHVSGIPELVRHGETGWLTPPGDAVTLAGAIAALAADPPLRTRLGRNARALVEAEFAVGENARKLVALFQGIVSEGVSKSPTLPKDPADWEAA